MNGVVGNYGDAGKNYKTIFGTNPQIRYDIDAAVKAGLSEADIAQYASGRRGYNYQGAREAGLSDADIIRQNIAGVSDAGALGAFAEETAEGLAVAPLAALGGGAGFAAATALGAPVALGVLGALVLGTAATAAGTFAVDEIKEALDIGGGQYVPSARPWRCSWGNHRIYCRVWPTYDCPGVT